MRRGHVRGLHRVGDGRRVLACLTPERRLPDRIGLDDVPVLSRLGLARRRMCYPLVLEW